MSSILYVKERKLKVNAGKGKVMVSERREEEVIDFNIAHRVRMPAVARCRIRLGSNKLEEVSKFNPFSLEDEYFRPGHHTAPSSWSPHSPIRWTNIFVLCLRTPYWMTLVLNTQLPAALPIREKVWSLTSHFRVILRPTQHTPSTLVKGE